MAHAAPEPRKGSDSAVSAEPRSRRRARGEALLARGENSAAAPLVGEARELFAALGATAWVDRASRAVPAAAA